MEILEEPLGVGLAREQEADMPASAGEGFAGERAMNPKRRRSPHDVCACRDLGDGVYQRGDRIVGKPIHVDQAPSEAIGEFEMLFRAGDLADFYVFAGADSNCLAVRIAITAIEKGLVLFATFDDRGERRSRRNAHEVRFARA